MTMLFNVYAFDNTSTKDEITYDVRVGKALDFFAALELKEKLQTKTISTWIEANVPINESFGGTKS